MPKVRPWPGWQQTGRCLPVAVGDEPEASREETVTFTISAEDRRACLNAAEYRCQARMFECTRGAHTVVAVPAAARRPSQLIEAGSQQTRVRLLAVCRKCARKIKVRAEMRERLAGLKEQPQQQLALPGEEGEA